MGRSRFCSRVSLRRSLASLGYFSACCGAGGSAAAAGCCSGGGVCGLSLSLMVLARGMAVAGPTVREGCLPSGAIAGWAASSPPSRSGLRGPRLLLLDLADLDVAEIDLAAVVLQADVALQRLVRQLLHRGLIEVDDLLAVERHPDARPDALDLEGVPRGRGLGRMIDGGVVAVQRLRAAFARR